MTTEYKLPNMAKLPNESYIEFGMRIHQELDDYYNKPNWKERLQ